MGGRKKKSFQVLILTVAPEMARFGTRVDACVKQLGSLKYEASQHGNSEDRSTNTASGDPNFLREIQEQQNELQLSVTIAKRGTASGCKTRTALKYCSRQLLV